MNLYVAGIDEWIDKSISDVLMVIHIVTKTRNKFTIKPFHLSITLCVILASGQWFHNKLYTYGAERLGNELCFVIGKDPDGIPKLLTKCLNNTLAMVVDVFFNVGIASFNLEYLSLITITYRLPHFVLSRDPEYQLKRAPALQREGIDEEWAVGYSFGDFRRRNGHPLQVHTDRRPCTVNKSYFSLCHTSFSRL